MALLRIQTLFLMAIFFLFSNTVISETFYVKSSLLTLKEKPRFSAPAILKMKKNSKIIKIAENGFWMEISFLENTGWVPRSSVSKLPVYRKIALRSQKYSPQKRSSRRHRIKTVTAVIGVRGLMSSEERKIKLKEKNFERLAIVESRTVNSLEALAFIQFQEN